MRLALYALVTALLTGCVVYQVPAPQAGAARPCGLSASAGRGARPPAPPPEEQAAAPAVSVYVEPPTSSSPPPIAVGWAPPPMLVEVPPPEPFAGAIWVGGYWVWQGNWVWAHGHWMGPPQPQYVWVHPYYEHRAGEVIFIDGHWSPPGVAFVPPPPGVLVVETPAVGVIPGPRPLGPEGCFVPAPPGSRAGIIIPAPVGTAPAVVTSAPAVVNVGMRITNNVTTVNNNVNNVTNVTNITRVTNVTNVTIVAPPGATRQRPLLRHDGPRRAASRRRPAGPRAGTCTGAREHAAAAGLHPGEPATAAPAAAAGPCPAGERGHGACAFGRAVLTRARIAAREVRQRAAAAHPTPTALGRDPGHVNPESARAEREYPGGYEHQPAPQAQGDHKSPPQPQNASRPAAQPQNANRPAAQPQNASRPAAQPQNANRNAAPQAQSQHQGAPSHAEGDNRSDAGGSRREQARAASAAEAASTDQRRARGRSACRVAAIAGVALG